MSSHKQIETLVAKNYHLLLVLFVLLLTEIFRNSRVHGGQEIEKSPSSEPQNQHDHDIVKWQLLIDSWNKESDRFWARNNIFLAVNAGLLVAVTTFLSEPKLTVLVSIFGIIFVLIWGNVVSVGKYYQDRWLSLIEQIESRWETKYITQFRRLRTADANVVKLKSSTTYMFYVLRLLLTLWFTISIYAGYKIYLEYVVIFDTLSIVVRSLVSP